MKWKIKNLKKENNSLKETIVSKRCLVKIRETLLCLQFFKQFKLMNILDPKPIIYLIVLKKR